MDRLSPDQRSRLMGRVRQKNTKPELVLRRIVFALGYRYRLHVKDLPGSPDLVFPSRRKVIFVHGCFWHRHDGCRLATVPKTRAEFWQSKFDANCQRDQRVENELATLGWEILSVWECETRGSSSLPSKIQLFLDGSTRLSTDETQLREP